MGYDVHITRAPDWSDSESAPITLDEWLAYVASDPEMRLAGLAEARSPKGEVIRIEGKGLSVWVAWPGEGRGEGHAWMDHRGGRIVAKNPDSAVLTKMCSIAEQLGARVQGDEGEIIPSPPVLRGWKRLFGRRLIQTGAANQATELIYT
jgi:hypothetical protein